MKRLVLQACLLFVALGFSVAKAQSLKLGDTSYTLYPDFVLASEPMKTDALPSNAIGSFAGHAVFNGENKTANLAYMLKKDSSEGVLLTNRFMARCKIDYPMCLDYFKLANTKLTVVDAEHYLGLITVKSLKDWYIINQLYQEHQKEFDNFYPVLDRGKTLRNHDAGTFGGENNPFKKQKN